MRAAAAAEQMQTEEMSMNSFASSNTELFETIEESPRQCKGVEDHNDDEIRDLCKFSNELKRARHSSTQSVEVRVARSEVGTP